MEDNSAKIAAIIDGPDSDLVATEKLRALGVPDSFAAELVAASRHDGVVDNYATVIDRPGS